MPEMLGFTPRWSLAQPPNKWRTDNGRQAMGHDTGYNTNNAVERVYSASETNIASCLSHLSWELTNSSLGTCPTKLLSGKLASLFMYRSNINTWTVKLHSKKKPPQITAHPNLEATIRPLLTVVIAHTSCPRPRLVVPPPHQSPLLAKLSKRGASAAARIARLPSRALSTKHP